MVPHRDQRAAVPGPHQVGGEGVHDDDGGEDDVEVALLPVRPPAEQLEGLGDAAG